MRKYYVTKATLQDNRQITISAGPSKTAVIDMTVDFVLDNFKQVNVANMKQTFYDGLEFTNSGLTFNIEEQMAENILNVL